MAVLITGCSSGFGLLAAVEFARRGDQVFATMRNVAKAGDLNAACDAAGVKVEVLELDVTVDESVKQGVERVLAEAGRIDVLVNNAGVSGRGAVETFPDDGVHSIFDTNVFGVLRMLRAVLPTMRAQRSGAVVNVSSFAGLMPMAWNSIYAGSKHALEAITEGLALEVRPFGVRVALIEPGWFRTAIADNAAAQSGISPDSPYYEQEHRALETMKAGVARGGDPQEVVSAIIEAATAERPRLRYPLGMGNPIRTTDNPEWGTLRKRIALPAD